MAHDQEHKTLAIEIGKALSFIDDQTDIIRTATNERDNARYMLNKLVLDKYGPDPQLFRLNVGTLRRYINRT